MRNRRGIPWVMTAVRLGLDQLQQSLVSIMVSPRSSHHSITLICVFLTRDLMFLLASHQFSGSAVPRKRWRYTRYRHSRSWLILKRWVLFRSGGKVVNHGEERYGNVRSAMQAGSEPNKGGMSTTKRAMKRWDHEYQIREPGIWIQDW